MENLAAKAGNSALFKVFAYAFLGGGLGGVLDEIRSFLKWHAEFGAFGKRFIWKTLLAPWQGAILGLIAVAMLKAGLVSLSGDFSPDPGNNQQLVAMFAFGALAGYGSRNVLKWLDMLVTRFFTDSGESLKAPNLIGKTLDEAKAVLGDLSLNVGQITPEGGKGTVIEQTPAPDAPIQRGGSVNLTFKEPPSEGS